MISKKNTHMDIKFLMMFNSKDEQLKFLSQGAKAWDDYRMHQIRTNAPTHSFKPELENIELTETNLNGIDLSHANLKNANLSKNQLTMSDLYKARLSGANLSQTDLGGASLSQAEFNDADLSSAILTNAFLFLAKMNSTNLSWANLSNADLDCANFENANLCNADLSNTNLYLTNFRNANLSRCRLKGVNLENTELNGANLNDADLSETNLKNTDLTRVLGLNVKQVRQAKNWRFAVYNKDFLCQLIPNPTIRFFSNIYVKTILTILPALELILTLGYGIFRGICYYLWKGRSGVEQEERLCHIRTIASILYR